MGKTVYILGAGFSMDAGAPSQAGLIKGIFELKDYDFPNKTKAMKWIDEFSQFIYNVLHISREYQSTINLEDIYTPIDKAIIESSSLGPYTSSSLLSIRNNINKLIILSIRHSIRKNDRDQTYIDLFAKHIVELSKCKLKNEKDDEVAVITTNWDILLDNKVFHILNPKNKNNFKTLYLNGVVDYCSYISSLDKNDERVKPGLYAIGKGGYNVKILKLHGSLNWLQCPKCNRLFVKFYKNFPGGYVFKNLFCRHCDRNFNTSNDNSNKLYVNLITPTFLKNFNNIQNKLIWQNAGIELAEASKIIFMGYSLPTADFEFKQLLTRMLRKEVKIEAVLTENDNYENESHDYSKARYRYESFFNGRELEIKYMGVQNYIFTNCK